MTGNGTMLASDKGKKTFVNSTGSHNDLIKDGHRELPSPMRIATIMIESH